MQYYDFHGEKISRLGFGLMRLPVINGDQSNIDYEQVKEMVLYAYENGVNYFDTAYPYHNGFSEKTIGRIMEEEGLRKKINVATKLFTLAIDRPDFDPAAMFAEQLSRLRTDYIDFYLVHGLQAKQWQKLVERFDIKNFLRELKASGKVRYIGFSFHDGLDAFKTIIDDFEWDFAQIQYNYLDNELQAGDEGVAYAMSKGVPINVMEPLKGGNLIFPDYPEVDAIKEKYGISDISNAELGFSFVYDNPGFLTILSGMSNLQQVKENILIADRSGVKMMDEARRGAVREIRELIANSDNIPCTGCRYCTAGCPVQISIPTAFSCYNEGVKFRNPDAQRRSYDRACGNIADCIECGQCMDACPQHLEIPDLLKKVRAYFG